ncbi:MAG: hypothetical protein JNK04_15260, partial [Myxococcales bacterium]|nr:hypothetical protein [Myxococcales bacterium]
MARAGLTHAYPEELAAFVVARLEERGTSPVGLHLPRDLSVVEAVLSV